MVFGRLFFTQNLMRFRTPHEVSCSKPHEFLKSSWVLSSKPHDFHSKTSWVFEQLMRFYVQSSWVLHEKLMSFQRAHDLKLMSFQQPHEFWVPHEVWPMLKSWVLYVEGHELFTSVYVETHELFWEVYDSLKYKHKIWIRRVCFTNTGNHWKSTRTGRTSISKFSTDIIFFSLWYLDNRHSSTYIFNVFFQRCLPVFLWVSGKI